MECKNGQKYPTPADIFSREIEWKRRNAYARGLQLAFATRLSFPFPAQAMRIQQYSFPVFPPPMLPSMRNQEPNPFMNMMDEISYWVTTKRAPCLLNYDNAIKRQTEQAHCSKDTLKTTPNADVNHSKNKKRKLKLLDDSESSEKQQNVFFEKSVCKDIKAAKSAQSDSLASSIDFKIKPTIQRKPKRPKVQKKDMRSKINKVCTSTPKTNLRRSLRKVQQSNNNYSQLNDSFEILNASAIAAQDKLEIKVEPNEKTNCAVHSKNETNGNYEDSSDVSGFTANYIRSTKMHSSKTTTKAQNKGTRNKAKIKKKINDNDNILMCLNKSVNTGNPNAVLNCSTDSSHNIINIVTVQQDTTSNVDNSTSLLKFVNIKNQEPDSQKNVSRQRNHVNHETSFQSRSSNTSRYPTRHRKISMVDSDTDAFKVNTSEKTSRAMPKESKSERKENSANMISKTRSGRKIGPDVDPEVSACTRLNVDSTGDQVSSSPTLNVVSRRSRKNNSRTSHNNKTHKNNKNDICDESEKNIVGETSCVQLRSTRRTRQVAKANNETGQKDSLRDKSGFATCFTDSDSDNEPLKQRKFFC